MARTKGPPRIVGSRGPLETNVQTHILNDSSELSGDDRQFAFETRPSFASSWIVHEQFPEEDVVEKYTVDGVPVTVLAPRGRSCGTYLVDPPEYRMNPRHLKVLAEVKEALRCHGFEGACLPSLSMMRSQIELRAKDMIYSALVADDSDSTGRGLERRASHLARILGEYTAGFGVLETMLKDSRVQDIYVDAPSGEVPVQVVLRSDTAHSVRQKCRTNVFVGARDLRAFVSRIKYESGLPFSEAVPVLEADLRNLSSRITLVSPPLSDRGISMAIRRHSCETWTIPRLIANGSLSPLLGGFLWACAIGRRAALIAGSRGAGKTTLLTATMLEFPMSQRILLIEDTPEIPVGRFQEMGYDIQTLRFSSGGVGRSLVGAKEALKTSLRMGESAIIIGEVRGEEARVLYESMRAGSAGSSVLGTIHGNSARGVLDRAVEDLGVSERAFSSTDIVVVIGLIRSPDGSRFRRQVVEVAEVRSHRNSIDLVPLFEFSGSSRCARPTDEFTSRAKSITGIATALGISPERTLEVVKAKAHANQILSATGTDDGSAAAGGCDSARIRLNETFTECVLAGSSPEIGLKEWIRLNDLRT